MEYTTITIWWLNAISYIFHGKICITSCLCIFLFNVSVLNETPIILRPGIITKEMIEKALNKEVLIAKEVTAGVNDDSKVLSPGMKYKHYSPNAEVIIINSNLEKFITYIDSHKDDGTYALCFDGEEKLLPIPSISYGKEDDEISQAHNLFSALREIDKIGAKKVFARCPKTSGISLAVYNRLIRSAGFKVIDI